MKGFLKKQQLHFLIILMSKRFRNPSEHSDSDDILTELQTSLDYMVY